jgi:peroxiredoxin
MSRRLHLLVLPLCALLVVSGCSSKVKTPDGNSGDGKQSGYSSAGDNGNSATGADGQPLKKLSRGEIIDRADRSVALIDTSSGTEARAVFGSGFLIDGRGWVATNWHVIQGASNARVKFRNGTEIEAQGLVAVDEEADIAVLKLPSLPEDATPLELGPAAPPRQGDSVSAIGHPQGFNFTVTEGIVSAVRTTSELPREYAAFLRAGEDTVWIQTSAAISGGNSGGPLLDEYGRVVGINTWVAVGENLGFAIHVRHLAGLLEKPSPELIPLPGRRPLSEMEDPFVRLEPRVQSMVGDFQLAARQFQVDLLGARSDQEREELRRTKHPGPKYAQRLFEMADQNRRTLLAFQALALACRLDDPTGEAAYLKKALERLAEDHLKDVGLHHIFGSVAATRHDAAVDFFRRVITDSPHRRNQALASYFLAGVLQAREKPEEHKDEVIVLLDRCQTEWGDIKVGTTRLEAIASPLLHKVKHLSAGSKAMEIAGVDVDGKELKLSGYRGKVVLLDFFADWCPHCVAMYPHERKLVEQYAGKPFAILGVNGDSQDTLRQLIDGKRITWPCWADGNEGPITREWQVTSLPTMFLIDHEGRIRQVLVGRPGEEMLDKMIRELVDKVPAKATDPE